MGEISIRRAVISDLPYLYEICLKTGHSGRDASEFYFDPYLFGQYYAAPYLIYPEGICIVAEYLHRPYGYVVAVGDTVKFSQWMESEWLPPLRARYTQPFPQELIRTDREKSAIDMLHRTQFPVDLSTRPHYVEYPAHLHIDLLPEIQQQGVGRKLINSLFDELSRQNVPGLHLNVSASNPGAIAFYRKTGFIVIKEQEYGLCMGRKCT